MLQRLSIFLVSAFITVSVIPLHAQVTATDSVSVVSPGVTKNEQKRKEKDITDVLRKLFRLSPSQKSDNMQPGDDPVISFLPAVGYTLQTRFAAILSGNIAFYSSKTTSKKLSVINASPTYTQNKQFTFPLQLNIWLKGDKYNLIGDWRYMKYPQSTFGLGSDKGLDMEDPMNYKYIRIYQYLLKKITAHFSAGLGYNLDYHWNITEEGVAGVPVSDYAGYGASFRSVSSGPSLSFVYDSRKNPINASQGIFGSLVLRDNVKWMGSHTNWQSVITDFRKYVHLPAQSKNVLAFWNYNWIILHGKPPYLDLPSTGWDSFNNTGRGFIQGRFRGNVMLYGESEYRFRITSNGLLGGVAFINAQSFSGAPSYALQRVQVGKGIGLRIKLNKKSNTNIAIDYGFGTLGMKGVFVNVGEVF